MKTHELTFGVVTLALVTTATSLGLSVGCSSAANPSPDASAVDSSTTDGSSSADRKNTGSDSRVDTSDAGEAGDAAKDVVSLDTGKCKSEASTCNTCYSDAQAAAYPYNACSPYTANCVPFTLTVPSHPEL